MTSVSDPDDARARIDALTRHIETLEARLRATEPSPRSLSPRPFRALRFVVGTTSHAIDTESVQEIIRVARLARVRSDDGALLGILDFHGSPVPVVDLRARLGWGRTAWTANTPIIVLRAGARRVGLLVDRVVDLLEVDSSHHRCLDGAARADVSVVGLVEVNAELIPVLDPELVITLELGSDLDAAQGLLETRAEGPTEARRS